MLDGSRCIEEAFGFFNPVDNHRVNSAAACGVNVQRLIIKKQDLLRLAFERLHDVLEDFFIRLELSGQVGWKMMMKMWGDAAVFCETAPMQDVCVGKS